MVFVVGESARLLQSSLVGCLPDLGESHCRVETVEDAQGQRHSLYQTPRKEAVKLQLKVI